MSDPHPLLDTQKSLRRAAKITPINGHVVDVENGSSALSVSIAQNRRRGLGASIKGRFKTQTEFERSKSLNDVSFSTSPVQKDGLARSPSSVVIPSHPTSTTNTESSHQSSETPEGFNLTWAVSEPTTPQPMENITVPDLIQRGTLMTKVSSKRNKSLVLRVEADLGQIVWESRQQKISECRIIRMFQTGL
jgi:hypothetical protein